MPDSSDILETLYKHLGVGILLWSEEKGLVRANPEILSILGLSDSETFPITDLENRFYDEENNHISFENFPYHKVLQSGESIICQKIHYRDDAGNIYRTLETSVYPIPLNGVKHAIALINDITEQEALSETARKNQDFLQLILNNIPQHIFWKDTESVYQGCNTNFASAAGVETPQDIIGKTDFDLAWENSEAEAFRTDDSEVMVSGESKLHIVEPQHQADGKEAWLETNKVPLKDPNGDVTGVLGTFQDITELIQTRQKMSELLKTENERLEKLVAERSAELETSLRELTKQERMASLGSLVAGVSHEINTPLGIAVSAASFMKENSDSFFHLLSEGKVSKEDLIEFVKTIDETSAILNGNLARAAELVRSFKAISTNQSLDLKSAFDLRGYLESVILTLKYEYKRFHHVLKVESDEIVWIESHPSAYSQIFTNLIMNALRHGLDPEIPGEIVITLKTDPHHLSIDFSDNGKGIEASVLPRVFDPFFTTNRSSGGSGLGLNIVYNIVTDQLGGTIRCESVAGKGCTFLINIPLNEEESDE